MGGPGNHPKSESGKSLGREGSAIGRPGSHPKGQVRRVTNQGTQSESQDAGTGDLHGGQRPS